MLQERFSLGQLSGTTDEVLVHFGEPLYAAFATLADDPEATELSIAHVAKAGWFLYRLLGLFNVYHSGPVHPLFVVYDPALSLLHL